MALILNIETATTACSVALGRDGKCIGLKELNGDYTHAENLTLFIEDVMKQGGKKLSELDAIAVSKGPGSYTGLRIGVSTAKGLCYALEKPLISIETLKHLSASVISQRPADSTRQLYCAMLDARRMEVYCSILDSSLNTVRETSADIIDENSFADLLKGGRIIFFGDGAAKCRSVITSPNAIFMDNVFPSAKDMIILSEKACLEKKFEDVAYFEPFYLKDFVAGKKKKGT